MKWFKLMNSSCNFSIRKIVILHAKKKASLMDALNSVEQFVG